MTVIQGGGCQFWCLDVLAAKKPCPRYDFLLQQLKHSDEFIKMNDKYKDLYGYLATNSGGNVTNLLDVEYLYNTLFIEELYKLKLPEWTEKVYPDPMKELSAFSFTVPCYSPSLARLKVGPLLGNMVKNFEKVLKTDSKWTRKASIYSGHDITVANMLQGLQVFQPHSPPYYSLILLELRELNQQHYVTLYYRNSSAMPPQLLSIPGCKALCPYEQFKHLVSPLIPTHWETECQMRSFYISFTSFTGLTLIAATSVATLFLLLLLLALHIYRKQNYARQGFAYTSLSRDCTT